MKLDPKVYSSRRRALAWYLSRMGLDGAFLDDPLDIKYLTGFPCSAGALIILRRGSYFIADFRYLEQAERDMHGVKVVRLEGGLRSTLSRLAKHLDGAKLAYDVERTTVARMADLRSALKGRVSWKGLDNLVMRLRSVKTLYEIKWIEKAIRIAERSFRDTLKEVVRTRPSERKVASLLRSRMMELGAENLPFPLIVASGRRSSLVHTEPSQKRMAGTAVIDWGAVYCGYCCDITRTVAIGKASKTIKEMHAVVVRAIEAALERISMGAYARDVDAAARKVIREAGWGEWFGHGLGHGVGMDVHESPVLAPKSEDVLIPGMVVTVEPGIYVPGVGGVRVEEMVLVTEKGYRLLTSLPRDLLPDAYLEE